MPKTPFFSIVIPTLNEEKYLPFLLKDLKNQSYKDFEVIHVDGHSDDKTLQKAKVFQKQLSLTCLNAEKRNVSFQRNLGASKSQGNWVIFMDADNRLDKNFLADLHENLADSATIDIFTTWMESNEKNPSYKIINSILNLGLDLYQSLNKPAAFGALIGCRRQILKNLHFDETQKVLEDSLFVSEACKKGYKFEIFHHPTYLYSLRRVKKEGIVKISLQALLLQQMYLRGKDFQLEDHGYLMAGGQIYQATDKKKHLQAWKKLLDSWPKQS